MIENLPWKLPEGEWGVDGLFAAEVHAPHIRAGVTRGGGMVLGLRRAWCR